MTRTAKQNELLCRVADRIENDPALYDQTQWLNNERGQDGYIDTNNNRVDFFDCDTTACIAGWTVLEAWADMFDQLKVEHAENGSSLTPFIGSPFADPVWGIPAKAREVLGLEEDESDILFSEDWLPRDYSDTDDHVTLCKKTAEALRDMASGKSVVDVSQEFFYEE